MAPQISADIIRKSSTRQFDDIPCEIRVVNWLQIKEAVKIHENAHEDAGKQFEYMHTLPTREKPQSWPHPGLAVSMAQYRENIRIKFELDIRKHDISEIDAVFIDDDEEEEVVVLYSDAGSLLLDDLLKRQQQAKAVKITIKVWLTQVEEVQHEKVPTIPFALREFLTVENDIVTTAQKEERAQDRAIEEATEAVYPMPAPEDLALDTFHSEIGSQETTSAAVGEALSHATTELQSVAPGSDFRPQEYEEAKQAVQAHLKTAENWEEGPGLELMARFEELAKKHAHNTHAQGPRITATIKKLDRAQLK